MQMQNRTLNNDNALNNNIKDKLILAMDVSSKEDVFKYLKILKNKISIIKIGSYLFTKEGPEIIRIIHDEGYKVFLDLKFHDIPNTVAKTAEIVTGFGVYMFTIHTVGGKEMMRKCVKSVEAIAKEKSLIAPIIVGVTVLSSIDDKILHRELKLGKKRNSYVKILAQAAYYSELSGVVASGEEIKNIKKICGNDFIVVVPGIRPLWFNEADDQKKTLTPGEAIKLGADYIVVGRPILKSVNPEEAICRIYEEICIK